MDYSLQNKIARRLKQLKRDNVKFISGTIAPAQSCTDVMAIEPVHTALEYYEEKDMDLKLSVQLKWMGSRGSMYLFQGKLEDSFLVTRSGFKIGYGSDRLEESKNFFKHWYKKVFDDAAFAGASEVILDGEAMPWNAIGEGLIQRQFVGYSMAVHAEVDFLEEYNFGDAIRDTIMSDAMGDYDKLEPEQKKKHPMRETYEIIAEGLANYDNDTQRECIDKFDTQLDNYNRNEKPFFVAFDILRIKYPDGTVMVDEGWLASHVTKYSFLRTKWPAPAKKMVKRIMDAIVEKNDYVSGDNISFRDIFDIGLPVGADSDTQEQLEELMALVQSFGFEGIMVKPEFPMDTDAVHAMKIRNPEYLRLIYGHDYTIKGKYEALVEGKRTGKKRKLSHNEYRLGIQMLKLNESSPTYEEDFERIAKKILFDIEEESTVDSRL